MASQERGPFRADQVGSLLRPQRLKEARAARDKGAITAGELALVEDGEIEKIVARQAEIGLKVATDGEFRRAMWSIDFFEHLDGLEGYLAPRGPQFKGIDAPPNAVRLTGRVGFPRHHPMLEHFKFLKARGGTVAKMTIPSPAVLHFRAGSNAIDRTIYPDIAVYFDDLAATWREAVAAFYDAGCRYLQLDDTVWAYLCSADEREQARRRGDDPDELQQTYARVINAAIAGRPKDMVITTHLCRGNFRSSWISEGGYEPVAEILLGRVDYDGYFLEYDSARAGGFEPLRFLPKGEKKVVLGLVTSKTGALEDADALKRRIDEAARYADLGQLCLSPQCGFASTEIGNILSDDEQWAKLARVVEVSRAVWGDG